MLKAAHSETNDVVWVFVWVRFWHERILWLSVCGRLGLFGSAKLHSVWLRRWCECVFGCGFDMRGCHGRPCVVCWFCLGVCKHALGVIKEVVWVCVYVCDVLGRLKSRCACVFRCCVLGGLGRWCECGFGCGVQGQECRGPWTRECWDWFFSECQLVRSVSACAFSVNLCMQCRRAHVVSACACSVNLCMQTITKMLCVSMLASMECFAWGRFVSVVHQLP